MDDIIATRSVFQDNNNRPYLHPLSFVSLKWTITCFLTANFWNAAQQFDQQALAQIYDTYSPGLYRYSMRRLSDQDMAEDCVAETFSRFLQALKTRRGPQSFLQAFLYRIAHNWIVDHYRRGPTQPQELTEEHPDENADPEKDAGRHLQQESLRMAIRN